METARDQLTTAHRAAAERLMQAMRERDYAFMAAVLADDVVNSPITDGFQFRGRDDAIALLQLRNDGRLIEGVDLLRFDTAAMCTR